MHKMIPTNINGNWDIILPDHRAARPEYHSKAGWERARLDALHDEIKKEKQHNIAPVVYYVGAEEGEHPALCQMWGAEVVMFEPNPRVWPNIKAIWDANKLEYPTSYCGFASNATSGQLNLFYKGFPPSAQGEVISDHGFMNLSEIDYLTMSQIKIDDLVAFDHMSVPSILTMDVEGSEWEVLRGAEKTIRNHKPVIFLSLHPEFMYEMYHEYAYDCRHWIQALGYEEKLLDYQHEVHLVYHPIRNNDAA